MTKQITILINQRPFHLEDKTLDPAGFRELVGAPDDYEVWRIEGNPDPEGQLPEDDEQVMGPTEVRSGQRFRVVPPGTFGASR